MKPTIPDYSDLPGAAPALRDSQGEPKIFAWAVLDKTGARLGPLLEWRVADRIVKDNERIHADRAPLRQIELVDRALLTQAEAEIARLTDSRAAATSDTQRLDWWFAHGLNDSVCDGSVDLWWADGEAECERVTHGTTVRDTIDRAMRGEYEHD